MWHISWKQVVIGILINIARRWWCWEWIRSRWNTETRAQAQGLPYCLWWYPPMGKSSTSLLSNIARSWVFSETLRHMHKQKDCSLVSCDIPSWGRAVVISILIKIARSYHWDTEAHYCLWWHLCSTSMVLNWPPSHPDLWSALGGDGVE